MASELNVQWSEYWTFLEQFMDLTSDNGLEMVEEYFRKRVWLKFIKDFKEKQCIIDENLDPALFQTPVIQKPKRGPAKDTTDLIKPETLTFSTGDEVDSKNSGEKKVNSDHEVDGEKRTKTDVDSNNGKVELMKGSITDSGRVEATKGSNIHNGKVETITDVNNSKVKDAANQSSSVASDVLSPVTQLTQNFANLGLNDESWSERATVASLDRSDIESRRSDGDYSTTEGNNTEKLDKEVDETNCDKQSVNDKLKDTTGDVNGNVSEPKSVIEKDKSDNGSNLAQDSRLGSENNTTVVSSVKEMVNGCAIGETKDEVDNVAKEIGSDVISGTGISSSLKSFQRHRSTSAGSSESFETADVGSDVSNLSYCSLLSDSDNQSVCVRIHDSQMFTTLKDYFKKGENNLWKDSVGFILQWKVYSMKQGQKVTLVSVPTLDIASKILLLENIDVASSDGDLSQVAEGEVIKVNVSGETNEEKLDLQAYLTRAETLPKCGYIHG